MKFPDKVFSCESLNDEKKNYLVGKMREVFGGDVDLTRFDGRWEEGISCYEVGEDTDEYKCVLDDLQYPEFEEIYSDRDLYYEFSSGVHENLPFALMGVGSFAAGAIPCMYVRTSDLPQWLELIPELKNEGPVTEDIEQDSDVMVWTDDGKKVKLTDYLKNN